MAARTARRNASTPRQCPSKRGSPRAAQLPSMMSATWRGTTFASNTTGRSSKMSPSVIGRTQLGKPYLVNQPERSDLRFSISHARGLAVVATACSKTTQRVPQRRTLFKPPRPHKFSHSAAASLFSTGHPGEAMKNCGTQWQSILLASASLYGDEFSSASAPI